MSNKNLVLVSWVAVNNDPYERARRTEQFIKEEGEKVAGPTLTLLFDSDSPYKGKIRDIVLFHRDIKVGDNKKESRAVTETIAELRRRDEKIRIKECVWSGSDPTDHREIFEFVRAKIGEVRKNFQESNLILHISPGTPSMQTIWVLMAETGFVDPPFCIVKSYRRKDRRGRPPVVQVKVGLDTFYKRYITSQPAHAISEDQAVMWDLKRFRIEEMRALYTEARRFAQVKVPVLILGERGTGKSTLASWVRQHSPYRKESLDYHWPVVACGQYTPELIRGELFGWKKDSHSRAREDREGLLDDAHKDTLFLDEIGDLDRDCQRLLIKAIEEKKFLPVGGRTEDFRDSDFRLICATNLDVTELKKKLTPDFLDRINNLILRLPPLREITGELDWLWKSVFTKATNRAGVSEKAVQFAESHHERVVSYLKNHPLPGNIRDLFKVAYRIVAARGDAHDRLSPGDAVEYGLKALSDRTIYKVGNISKDIARAFAESHPLDSIINSEGRISTKELEQDLHCFLARELKRIAQVNNCSVEEFCDKSARTLRAWNK